MKLEEKEPKLKYTTKERRITMESDVTIESGFWATCPYCGEKTQYQMVYIGGECCKTKPILRCVCGKTFRVK